MSHIAATPEAGKQFYQAYHDQGKVVMLNLLKFKTVADYSGLEHLDPGKEISGREAYQLYMEATTPLLKAAGSRVLFLGESAGYLIGPQDESWDLVLLVEHGSVAQFVAFAQNEDDLKTAGHRTAALADSRLLPISQK
ncbi:MAG TPA: DUF1330 domain-containing protein [Cytophagales bacterium]|nr:DUF1330 domain-containing protein [Cytophagales bacterium]